MPVDPNVVFDSQEDPEWLTSFLTTAQRTEKKHVIRYTGACPHCAHWITLDVPIPQRRLRWFRRARFRNFEADAEDEGDEAPKAAVPAADGRLRCNCIEGHTGTGALPTGCGRYGYAGFDRQ